jgi:ubiquinone/menaquinone biosynthesis C-methylase UbiE
MSESNHWLDEKCARAFWDQSKALPYQELLQDTASWLEPKPGERWLDLGCGSGQLTAALWQRGQGRLGEIVAVDCNPVNGPTLLKMAQRLSPAPKPEQIRFACGNFSEGLPQFAPEAFDGIVSGLAISYAEHRDPATGRYTDHAYNRLLTELWRVLRPGGRLVFSVNVPRPRFWPILWKSLRLAFRVSKPGRVLLNGLKMQGYGRWLKKEAARGRFHFLPVEEIAARLTGLGFEGLTHRLSYAGQAYVVSARKPRLAA